jgi:hypothetical protein
MRKRANGIFYRMCFVGSFCLRLFSTAKRNTHTAQSPA